MAYGNIKVDGIQNSSGETLDIGSMTVLEASTSAKGYMSAADKAKLVGVEAGAEVNTVTSVNGLTGAVTVQGFSGDYGDLSNKPTIPTIDADTVVDGNYVATDENYTSADRTKLAGIELYATGDQSPSEILNAIRGVDGPGSGLDADTLDGLQGSFYTNYTNTAIANLVDSSPSTLDTLNELAAALGDDANFSTTVTNSIATKLPLAGGQMTGDITFSGSQTVDGRDLSADGTKLDGIESNATANQTAAEILTAIKTVDGSGSGLDADYVDGVEASSFLRSDASDSWSADLETTSTNGIRFGNPNQNDSNDGFIAAARFGSGLNIVGTQTASGIGRQVRLWGDVITNGGDTFWNAGNDGAGSGLDADTLDGVQGANFLRSDSDDVATGRITLGSAISVGSSAKIQVGGFQRTGPIMLAVGTTNTTSFDSTNERWIMNDGTYMYASTSSNSYNSRIWTDSNDGAGSGLDADLLDGITWNSSGKDLRGTEIYADGWFRNYTSGKGLYNEATGCHWASDANEQWTVRDSGNSIRINFKTNGTTQRASVYADNTPSIGFLNSGNQWGLRYLSNDGNSPNLYFREEGNETWTGNPGADMGKIEYHSNRFYIAAGSNSTFVCQFRRGASDVGYWSNSGEIYATSSNHKVWHAGNDGSGSGLDADYVDGVEGSSFLRSDASDSSTQRISFQANATNNWDTIATGSGAQGSIEIYNSQGGNDAFMAFHTGGDYALYFGLDADTNDLSVGGWSMGANKYRVWHAGNDGSGSGLDADTVDGIPGENILRSGTTNNLNITNKGYYTTATGSQNQNTGAIHYGWGYQAPGAWSHPYPDIVFGFHTGMRFGGHINYGGCRFYNDHPSTTSTMLFAVGNGNSDVTVTNNLTAGGNITAYSSDRRLKENFKNIESPLEKISKLNGCHFDWIKNIEELGFTPEFAKDDVGLIAQEVEAVCPQAVAPAPFDHEVDINAEDPKDRVYKSKSGQDYLTVKYEKLVPLLVECIKELKSEVDELKAKLEEK